MGERVKKGTLHYTFRLALWYACVRANALLQVLSKLRLQHIARKSFCANDLKFLWFVTSDEWCRSHKYSWSHGTAEHINLQSWHCDLTAGDLKNFQFNLIIVCRLYWNKSFLCTELLILLTKIFFSGDWFFTGSLQYLSSCKSNWWALWPIHDFCWKCKLLFLQKRKP